MKNEILVIGLDVHAKNITIALAEGARKDFVHAAGGGREASVYGAIANDLHALDHPRIKVYTPKHESCYSGGVAVIGKIGRGAQTEEPSQ